MNCKEFQKHKCQFINAFREVLSERGNEPQLVEAAFCAYADPNPLIRFLFWRRLWVTIGFLQSQGPYEAVLDFGCGSGVTLPLLADFSNRAVGIDINLEPYRALSEHFSFADDVEIYETKQCPLPSFEDDTFNVVVALDVLEHVESLEDTLRQLCRITSKGGVIIVSGPTESLFYKIGRKIAGKEYTGDYHVRNIYDIRRTMKHFMEIKKLATLYYPFPLFEVYVGYVPNT